MAKDRRPDKKKCRAHSSRTGEPCKLWAIRGGTVCNKHGGRAPHVKAAAQARRVEQEIGEVLGWLDIKPVHDPLTALSELAGEIVAWKELAAARVAELTSLAQRNYTSGSDEVRAEIQVFERAMDRAVTVLATIARLKIDERLAAINERQAALVRDVLMGSLQDAGLTGDVQREVAGHVTRRLRVVAG